MQSNYKIRHDIVEGNNVHCLAFTCPLLDLDLSDEEIDLAVGQTENLDAVQVASMNAKAKWSLLCDIVLDEKTQIPLK